MNKLLEFIAQYYSPQEYSALAAQLQLYRQTRPLASAKILDATPVFRNTLVKYAVLLAAGADLTISVGRDIPCDPEILQLAPRFGIKVADSRILQGTFDVVADCAGRHKEVNSRYGFAELTRSGLEYYRGCKQPVFSVDSGILKRFETSLGTGESFVRAMKHLGYTDFNDKVVVIFGGGKVGKGTAYFAAKAGAKTFIIDQLPITPPDNVTLINSSNKEDIKKIVSAAWCVVSATGLPDVLAEYVPMLQTFSPLTVNMGVEDEFGSTLPADAVLNKKRPLNFILDEPTALKFIDPSMALSNAALVKLLNGEIPAGINMPPRELEMQIIADIRQNGNMEDEINLILKEYLS